MVTLPPEYTATKYPGYFWNTETKKLFSIKIGGELRQMTGPKLADRFNHWTDDGYIVSVRGRRKFLALSYLMALRRKNTRIKVRATGKGKKA